MTTGPDGNLWITDDGGNKIARVTPQPVVTEWTIPTSPANANGIITGIDGNIWSTEGSYPGKIGCITVKGVFCGETAITTANSGPGNIVSGPDGNLYFTEHLGNKIGIMSTNGVMIGEYALPTGTGPWGITVGPDGNIWFTIQNAGGMGYIGEFVY